MDFISDLPNECAENIFQSVINGLSVVFINTENGALFSNGYPIIEPNYIKFTVKYPIDYRIREYVLEERWCYTTFIMRINMDTDQYESTEVDSYYEYAKQYNLA